ncbi:CoA binding domain-containing protein [Cercophora samala]|uniref:CoA binding domain-containing protein n=1 Tax=Cercophora samala TaxID=330535 RepID=A0AA40DAG7_9PEZI|nr:CoA binding domain-containing protein [Cercophora samala]
MHRQLLPSLSPRIKLTSAFIPLSVGLHSTPSTPCIINRHRCAPLATTSTPQHTSFSLNHNTAPFATMAATDVTLRTFFQSPNYAVVGASANQEKYGYKVFKWYLDHNLPVTPINPSGKPIPVDGEDHAVVTSLKEVQKPEQTSVSFITPPAVTLASLKEAKELGFPSVFLQPGTFNNEVLAFAKDNFRAVVAGDGGWGGEGWCVLVDGERGLKAVGKL